MKNNLKLLNHTVVTAMVILISNAVLGQDAVKKEWTYKVEPYGMFPNMSGKSALGNLPELNVEIESSQIFENLQMGAMLYLEASNEKWNINSDLLYMDIGKGLTNTPFINNGEISAKQLGWEVAGLYKIRPWFEAGIGGLLNSIKMELNVNRKTFEGPENVKRENSQTWLDPMLIAVVKNTSGKKIIYSFRGEIGGFGIGSDLAWQMQAYAGYRFSELFQIQGGYRIISLDYENGSGADRFLYDVNTYGPVVKFGFNF